MSLASADKSKPYMPKAGLASDGYSNEDEATATCFCGSVQLAFVSGNLLSPKILREITMLTAYRAILLSLSQPINEPGFKGTFVCSCADCHKISASMFCTNFIVDDKYLKHIRGQEKLTKFAQKETIVTGKTMSNYFCSTCGTLMYRVGERFPGRSILRLGTVDDFNLMETKLKPTTELFTKDRASWLSEVPNAEHVAGMGFGA